jgi:hypothetical protein
MKKKMSYLFLGLLFCMPFLLGPTCDGGGGGDPEPAKTASLNLSVKYPISYSAMECTSRMVWAFTPGVLTGSEGQSNQFTLDRNYSDTSDAMKNCYFTEMVGGLKAGTWTIEVTNGANWLTSCVQTLGAGTTMVKFTQGRVGCTTGLAPYPGD